MRKYGALVGQRYITELRIPLMGLLSHHEENNLTIRWFLLF